MVNPYTMHAWGAALLRVWLGVMLVMHGYYAYAVVGAAAAADMIVNMSYPVGLANALAWYLIVAHLLGGLLLMLGLLTRVAALANVPVMASAVFLHHFPQGFFMRGIVTDAAAGRAVAAGYELALTVLVMTLAVLLVGPGALSVDHAVGARRPPEIP